MATADNLKIAQQLLATMQQITAQVEKQTEAYHAQAQLVDALCKAQDCFGKIDAVKVKEVTEALREAQEKTKEFGKEIEEVADGEATKLEGALRRVSQVVKDVSIPAEFLNGLRSGLTISTNLFKNILSMGGSAFGLLKDIGGIFLSLPGRLLDFFQGAAGGGTDEYKGALEELRKEFGNLEVGTSAAVKNMTESMHGLGESGLRMSQVFGYGRAGLAKLLRENMEIAKGMGPIFSEFAASLRGSERDFTVLRKATGLNAEALKTFYITAREGGVDTGTAIKQLTKDIARAERTFGITAKEYGADLNYMMKETGTFGIMAPKQMLTVATYARKLGLSMEALKKVMDKSLNFEDAAQQAAKLSEGFNMNIDAMKLMKAQNPTEKLEMMRKAFFKTGRNIEQMTIQERKYLAETAGVSEEEARLAFSQKNRALSGAALDAQMKKSQKQQISQQEAMQQLAKSIERLVQSGSAMKGSFFDIFAKGFESGVRRSKEFREVTRNLQRSLRAVYLAGREVGRMFVHEFPGFENMLKGLAETFDPRRFRELMSSIIGEFRKFFKALQTDPKAGVQEFMKNMKKIFFDFFTKGTPSGMKFLDGLKSFYKAVGSIFVEGARYALGALKDLLKMIVEFVKNPSSFASSGAGVLGEGIAGMFKQAFDYVYTELGPVLNDIGGLLVDLLSTLYKKYIEPHLQKIILGTLAFLFGPALLFGFIRGGVALLIQGIGALLTGASRTVNNIADGVTKVTRATGADGTVTETTISKQEETFRGISRGLFKIAGTIAAVALGVYIAVRAIISLAKIYEEANIKLESFLAIGAMFAGIALITAILVQTRLFDLLGAIKPNPVAVGGLLALAGIIAGLEYAVSHIIEIAKIAPKAEQIEAVAKLMAEMVLIFYAAAGLLAVATGIGAAEGFSFGTAAAAAIAGMASIGLAVEAIATTAKIILDKFGEIKPAKVNMVAMVMDKFTGFYIAVGDMLQGLMPYQRASGSSRQAEDILNKLNDVVRTMATGIVSTLDRLNITGDVATMQAKTALISAVLGGMSGIIAPLANFAAAFADSNLPDATVFKEFGTSISKIIGTLGSSIGQIMDKLRDMLSVVRDVNLIKGAGQAISSILTAIAGLIGGIMQLIPSGGGGGVMAGMAAGAGIGMLAGPVGAAVGAIIGAGVGYLAESSQFEAKIKAMKDIITLVSGSIKDLVKGITEPLTAILSLPNINENNIRAAQALGPIFTGIASILSGVMKSADAIKAFEGLNRMTPEQARNVINDFRGLIEKVGTSIESLIDKLKSFLTTSLGAMPTNISANQLSVYDKLGAILHSVGEIIGSVVAAASNVMYNALRTPQGRVSASDVGDILASTSSFMSDVLAALPGVLSGIVDYLPALIISINNLPNIPRGFTTKLNAIKATFEMISSITSFFSNFVGAAKGFDQGRNLAIEDSILGIKLEMMKLLRFFSSSGSGGIPDLLQRLIGKIAGLNFGEREGGTKGFLAKVSAMKSTFEMLATIVASIKTISDAFPSGGGSANTTTNKITTALQTTSSILETITSETLEGGNSSSDLTYILNPLYNIDLHNRVATINSLLKRSNFAANISGLTTKFGEIYNAVSQISGPDSDISSNVKKTIQNAFSVINAIVGKFIDNQAENPFSNIASSDNKLQKLAVLGSIIRDSDISRKIQRLSGVMTPLIDNIAGMATSMTSSSTVNLDAMQRSLDNIFGVDDGLIARLDSYFGDDTTAGTPAVRIQRISNVISGRLTTNIQGMVSSYNAFIADLARLNTDINVSLRQAEVGLGGRQTLAVRNAAVNATINVNVTLDTDQITTAQRTRSSNATATSPVLQMTAFNPGWNTQG